MIHQFEHNLLNKHDDLVFIETSEENRVAATSMARQATRTLDLVSRDLDPVLYDDPDFVEAVKQMVLKSQYSRVRILAHEPQMILKRGHRLLDLSFQLTSFFELRVPGKEHSQYNETFAVFDATGYIHRIDESRFEGKLNFNDKRMSRLLLRQFDEIWEKSRQDSNFKRALL